MAQVKIGLAPKRTSFFDPLTNTYMTLDKPVKTLTFDDNTDLSRIAHALFCQYPALVLYEGEFPQAAIDKWKSKFDAWGGPQAKKRADKVAAASASVITQGVTEAQQVTIESVNEPVAEAVPAAVEAETAEGEKQSARSRKNQK